MQASEFRFLRAGDGFELQTTPAKKGSRPAPFAMEPYGYYSAYRGDGQHLSSRVQSVESIVLSGRRIQSANAWHSADVNRAKVK